MNSKRNTLLAAAAAVGLTTTLLGATASFAADTTPTNAQTAEREAMHAEMKTFRDSVETTVKNNDFNSWKDQMLAQNQKMKEQADAQVTQENFDTLKKAHDLKEAGKDEEARELMKDSGMHRPMMGPGGPGGEHRGSRDGKMGQGDQKRGGEKPADAPADAPQ